MGKLIPSLCLKQEYGTDFLLAVPTKLFLLFYHQHFWTLQYCCTRGFLYLITNNSSVSFPHAITILAVVLSPQHPLPYIHKHMLLFVVTCPKQNTIKMMRSSRSCTTSPYKEVTSDNST